MRQIAEEIGLTKPALYYHFASREELVSSLIRPLIDDIETSLAEDETASETDARELLGTYFDISYRHRIITGLMLRDLPALSELGFVDQVLAWRHRLTALLMGSDEGVAARARATVALGGLADCLVLLPEVPEGELRAAAVDAACSALGLPPENA